MKLKWTANEREKRLNAQSRKWFLYRNSRIVRKNSRHWFNISKVYKMSEKLAKKVKRAHKSLNNWYAAKVVLNRIERCTLHIIRTLKNTLHLYVYSKSTYSITISRKEEWETGMKKIIQIPKHHPNSVSHQNELFQIWTWAELYDLDRCFINLARKNYKN